MMMYLISISQMGRNGHATLLSEAHSKDALLKAFNNLPLAQSNSQRPVLVQRRVNLLAILQRQNVLHGDPVAHFGGSSTGNGRLFGRLNFDIFLGVNAGGNQDENNEGLHGWTLVG